LNERVRRPPLFSLAWGAGPFGAAVLVLHDFIMGPVISRELVVAAYRLFLGREPESEEVIRATMNGLPDWQSLRRAFLHSQEFRRICSPSVLMPVHDLAPPVRVETETDPATLAKMLQHVQRVWTELGEQEPYWSVITSDEFRKASFSKSAEQFWSSGEADVERFLTWLRRNRISPDRITSVLEFGCGTGRVTAWLAGAFPNVIGYDISRHHLNIAEQHLRDVGRQADLRTMSMDELERLPRVDAVFSVIVLQHNPPPVIRHILGRLLSALNPGGIAWFQAPTYYENYEFRAQKYPRTQVNPAPPSRMEMHMLPQDVIFELIASLDCRVVEVQPDSMTGSPEFVSTTFLVRKRED